MSLRMLLLSWLRALGGPFISVSGQDTQGTGFRRVSLSLVVILAIFPDQGGEVGRPSTQDPASRGRVLLYTGKGRFFQHHSPVQDRDFQHWHRGGEDGICMDFLTLSGGGISVWGWVTLGVRIALMTRWSSTREQLGDRRGAWVLRGLSGSLWPAPGQA